MSAWTSRIDLSEIGSRRRDLLAIVLAAAVAGYIAYAISESPQQALQFTFNGLSVGAIYALLAIGFTLVYSTVWFFDLYYGAAAAMGAYGIFYLRSGEALGGQYQVNDPAVNVVFALVTAGVALWALREAYHRRWRERLGARNALYLEALVAGGLGAYMGVVLTWTNELNVLFAPAIGLAAAFLVSWSVRRVALTHLPDPLSPHRPTGEADGRGRFTYLVLAGLPAATVGIVCGLLLANAAGSRLYLSWVVSCLLAGMVGLAFYRGLYVQIIQRTRSRLIMLVASLGVLLALTALTIIVFESAPRPLPDVFGSTPWEVGGATIKGFNVFSIGVACAAFIGLLLLLKRTAFGKSVRAIGDDEEVAKVVGINTTVVIAIVFFLGAVFAALAGVLNGHDTAIQPRMGLIMLLKGWIASVVGGIGNLYGAIVGGFALGMIEQFGIWNLAGEWKDVVSFVVLILFLSFWPNGLLPRR